MIYLILIVCFLVLGLLLGTEIGFLTANKIGIEIKKKQGKRSAKLLSNYIHKPELFMGTSLIGVSLILSVLAIFFYEFTVLFGGQFNIKGHPLIQFIFLFLVLIISVLFIGDLFAKSFFRRYGEKALNIFYFPISFVVFLISPLVQAMEQLAAFILKYLFNVSIDKNKKAFARIDLEHFERQLKTGKEESSQDTHAELFENALELSSIRIRECLIPRNEIIGVDIATPIEEIKQKFIESKHSKLIVYDNDLDNIVGYLHHLDFYKPQLKLSELIHKIPAIPEAMHAVELLNKFTKERKSIAWVVDEFGGTAGIVSMEDLLEEIFGEIEDEHDESEYVEKQLSKNEYILSGRLEVEYINEKFNLDIPTDFAETLSGYIIEEHNAIPAQNERIILGNYQYDILLVTKTRIETVKLIVLDEED